MLYDANLTGSDIEYIDLHNVDYSPVDLRNVKQ